MLNLLINCVYYEPIRGYIRLMPSLAPYNWQFSSWPNFAYNLGGLEADLADLNTILGRLGGLADGLPEELETETTVDLMLAEAVRSSAIEGQRLDRESVVSSIRNRLGLNLSPVAVQHRNSAGAGELMVAVRRSFADPLDATTLFAWHTSLMGGGGTAEDVGCWRSGDGAMQIVSGRIDRPLVHFEAPPAVRVPSEMEIFFEWFNATAPDGPRPELHAAVRSALSHLHFESVHPFEDGNGRIGRAVAEKALSQGVGRPVLLSLSSAIESERNAYYDALESAQRSENVTDWMAYFIDTVLRAARDSERQIGFVVAKSKFYIRHRDRLSPRQSKVIARMLEAGPDGFEGGINARKYVALTKVSKATATRDLQLMLEIGAIERCGGGGRSTSYQLVLQ